MPLSEKPNQRMDHVFVILRDDEYVADRSSAITVVKILRDEQDATDEAARLNKINQDKGAKYYIQLGRLDREEPG